MTANETAQRGATLNVWSREQFFITYMQPTITYNKDANTGITLLQDDIYQYTEHGEVVYQGTLVEIQAWLSLRNK